MDTTRIDIAYRPLRIAWAILSSDRDAFRTAVRYNFAFWGGCYNPVVMVDRSDQAKKIVGLYRADVIIPIGATDQVREFPKLFPHLSNPLFPESLFFTGRGAGCKARILDIQNLIDHHRKDIGWKDIRDGGVRTFSWEPADPLSDIFLMQKGQYPSLDDTGIDYNGQFFQATFAMNIALAQGVSIPLEWLNNPSLRNINTLGLERHYAIRPGWDGAGFYIGDAEEMDDLVCFWNLRAADINLLFVDAKYINRYDAVIPRYIEFNSGAAVSHSGEVSPIEVWSRKEVGELSKEIFGGMRCRMRQLCDWHAWRGNTIRPPMMCFGSSSALGVVSQSPKGKPKIVFGLNEKPFSSDIWFHSQ